MFVGCSFHVQRVSNRLEAKHEVFGGKVTDLSFFFCPAPVRVQHNLRIRFVLFWLLQQLRWWVGFRQLKPISQSLSNYYYEHFSNYRGTFWKESTAYHLNFRWKCPQNHSKSTSCMRLLPQWQDCSIMKIMLYLKYNSKQGYNIWIGLCHWLYYSFFSKLWSDKSLGLCNEWVFIQTLIAFDLADHDLLHTPN